MIRIEVRAGAQAGRTIEVPGDVLRVGSAADADIHLSDASVAAEHARLVVGAGGVLLEALGSDHGTARIRDGERTQLSEANGGRLALRVGDLVELGWGEDAAVLYVAALGEAGDAAHVMALRREGEAGALDPSRLAQLIKVERAIGAASGLDDVLVAIADAALELVPGATHATLALRDDDAYVPVLTRVRDESGKGTSPTGSVPVARAVFRKVVAERATVLAADAPRDVAGSQSLIGAQIKSIVGVPLFRGDDLEAVLQVDNRSAPAMLGQVDVDVLSVLGTSASLAVANARLIDRLRVAERELRRENTYLKGREAAHRGTRDIVGRGLAMRELLAQIDKVADTKVSVLIEGETGVGKELVASALHHRSRRRDKLFVTQNCAALPEQLLESELFGHKKGAFTGATDEKKGLFEIANGGTLFLDELGEMALSLQAKLLRALQEGEVRPVGATHAKHVDVRIVAATNRALEAEVKAGRFREDLYYRLKVFPLRVPPLRERRDDVPLLAGHFLQRYAREIGKTTSGFAQATMEMLVAYDWPGNVRELQNEVQRLVIQVDAGGVVTPELLSPHLRKAEGIATRAGVSKGTLRDMMDTVERYLLVESLREHDNNKTAAARTLGITREGLHKKLRLLGLTSRASDGDEP